MRRTAAAALWALFSAGSALGAMGATVLLLRLAVWIAGLEFVGAVRPTSAVLGVIAGIVAFIVVAAAGPDGPYGRIGGVTHAQQWLERRQGQPRRLS